MDQVALEELTSYPVTDFAKGDQVIDYNGETHYVYYLIEGSCLRKVTTNAGEDLFFEEYSPGDTVHALVGPYLKYATSTPSAVNEMVALSPVRAHRLTADEFDRFLDRHPAVMKELLQRLTDEYTTLMNNFIAKQKGQAAPRVAAFILECAEELDGRRVFSRSCSIADIARFLGMHRITANKIILALRSSGCIAYNNNCIEVTDADMLKEIAGGIRKIDYKK